MPPTIKTLQPPSPLVKWAGGKKWLLSRPEFLDLLPKTEYSMVELFCGGLAVSLGLEPSHVTAVDLNAHLINLYRQVQAGVTFSFERSNHEWSYYKARTRFNALAGNPPDQEMAELFFYMNRTCFNGLCRFNQKGEFNSPFAHYRNPILHFDREAYRERFSEWTFVEGDYASVVVPPDAFVYADPPYDKSFTGYTAQGFDWNEQVRLAHWLNEIAPSCQRVVTSNLRTDRIVALYLSLGFTIVALDAPRRISCNGNRDAVSEILAWK